MLQLLRLLLGTSLSTGLGEQFSEAKDTDLKQLVDALKAEKAKKAEAPQAAPIDRIKEAFSQLKDMHQPVSGSGDPSPLYGAQWPYGPIGAPQPAVAQASPATNQGPPVPMPQARPQEASSGDQPALMGFFKRNTAMMRDPVTGAFIDPAAAAKASPGILQGLFT